MIRAVLKFDLPEDEAAFRTALDAHRLKGVLYDFDNWLRAIVKHHTDLLDGESTEQFQRTREKLWEIANEWEAEIE